MKKLLLIWGIILISFGISHAGNCPVPEPVGCPDTTINMDNNTITGDVTFNDKVGIGATAPEAELQIGGASSIDTNLLRDKTLALTSATSTDNLVFLMYGGSSARISLSDTAYTSGDRLFTIDSDDGGFRIAARSDNGGAAHYELFYGSHSTGYVGIGDKTPSYGLDVSGTFRAVGDSIFDGDLDISTDFRVGNGTPDVTQDGEDAYIEGTLEVDSGVYHDAAQDDRFSCTQTETGTQCDSVSVGRLPVASSYAYKPFTKSIAKFDASGWQTLNANCTVDGDCTAVDTANDGTADYYADCCTGLNTGYCSNGVITDKDAFNYGKGAYTATAEPGDSCSATFDIPLRLPFDGGDEKPSLGDIIQLTGDATHKCQVYNTELTAGSWGSCSDSDCTTKANCEAGSGETGCDTVSVWTSGDAEGLFYCRWNNSTTGWTDNTALDIISGTASIATTNTPNDAFKTMDLSLMNISVTYKCEAATGTTQRSSSNSGGRSLNQPSMGESTEFQILDMYVQIDGAAGGTGSVNYALKAYAEEHCVFGEWCTQTFMRNTEGARTAPDAMSTWHDNWRLVDEIYFVIDPVANVTVSCIFDSVDAFSENGEALISVGLDDGSSDQLMGECSDSDCTNETNCLAGSGETGCDTPSTWYRSAREQLQQLGLTAFVAVPAAYTGDSGKATVAELQEAQKAGFDIVSHGFDHGYMDIEKDTSGASKGDGVAIDNEQQSIKNKLFLLQNGFTKGLDILAYPFGDYYSNNLDELRKYYSMGFGVGDGNALAGMSTFPPQDWMRIPRGFNSGATFAGGKQEVDQAVLTGSWYIPYWHTMTGAEYEIVSHLLGYIKTNYLDTGIARFVNPTDILYGYQPPTTLTRQYDCSSSDTADECGSFNMANVPIIREAFFTVTTDTDATADVLTLRDTGRSGTRVTVYHKAGTDALNVTPDTMVGANSTCQLAVDDSVEMVLTPAGWLVTIDNGCTMS